VIEPGDFTRPCQIRVQDGTRRDWLGRKRPVWRVVFAGFLELYEHDIQRGVRVVVVDGMERLRKQQQLADDLTALQELHDRLPDRNPGYGWEPGRGFAYRRPTHSPKEGD
jgi:hypothetical protein